VLEKKYEEQWNHNFSNRLKMGRILSRILQKEKLSAFMMRIVIVFPFLLSLIIKNTWQNHPIATIMFLNTKYRTDEPEIMDDFALEGEVLRDSLDKIAKINQLLAETS
jgi:hypothetical protein